MSAFTFADHAAFQKSVARASLGGAAAGVAGYALYATGFVGSFPSAAWLALGGAGVAAATGGTSLRTRLTRALLGAACGALPLLFPAHPLIGVLSVGAGLGLLFAHAREKEAGAVEVGQPRTGRAAYAAAAALCAVAGLAGTSIIEAFDARQLLEPLLPASLAAVARLGVFGFFLGIGSAGAHLMREPDPVEKLYAKLLPELTGDLKVLCARAMTNYRRCAEILTTSEPGFARAQLSKSLADVTARVLELGRRWQGIDRELGQRAEGEIEQRLSEVRTLREKTQDEVARRQLNLAESSLVQEREQIDRIRRGRERVVARLHGEMALLERTRFALLGLKSSDAHLRAAELSSLSESLSTVAREMDCEAEAVDEIISRVVDIRGADVEAAPALAVRARE